MTLESMSGDPNVHRVYIVCSVNCHWTNGEHHSSVPKGISSDVQEIQ